MENYKNVIMSSVSYRRNIKDMPFVKMLTDTEQAIGVSRSLSEILGDDFEFRSLKNLAIHDCLLLVEQEVITPALIDNKDISAYGANYDKNAYVLVNEQDHIRIVAKLNGYKLEECYKIANEIDDKILDKLEMCFSSEHGFLTANPFLMGTGMQIEVILFLPALFLNEKVGSIINEFLKDEFELCDITNDYNLLLSPFFRLKNKFTFGYKENEFAEKIDGIVKKIIALEAQQENQLFEFSASHLVDQIFKAYGTATCAYRLDYAEALKCLGLIQWGINLKVLTNTKPFDIFEILCKIKEHHINENNLNIKEQEKARAKFVANAVQNSVKKGDVDV